MDTERSVVLPSAPARGLTLIELLVALAVLAVLLAAGVPAFSSLAAGSRAAGAVNAVATDL
ncbi:MAG TPA: prepilin-type N-terminal cleavage/methylation domain-containing protein, partial [Chromatiales bacterium]|nr:prepilin-type N-terminal cleavage/methylation domain-containing protein [Chromatiales bacterium]